MKNHRTYKRFYKMIGKHLGEKGLGADITFSVIEGDPEYNPSTGDVEEKVKLYHSTAVRVSVKNHLFGEATVLTDDVDFYVPPVTACYTPLDAITAMDKVSFAGVDYTVVQSTPWDFAGVPLGYKIRAKVAS